MKILHIFRGFEDYIIEVMNIQSAEMDVNVIIPQTSQWITPLLDKRIKISGISPKSVKSLSNIAYIARLLFFIWKTKPDIIHIQAGVIWETTIYFALKNHFKIVTTVHDVICHPSENKRNTIQKWIDLSIRKSGRLICHTDESIETIRKKYNINSTFKIPHPVIRQYNRNPISKPERKIIFFGTLDKWKGLEILAQAIDLLHDTNINFEIRGNSKFKEHYASLFKNHKNVLLDIRRQSNEEIEQLFSSGSALVLPYIEASQSGVLHIAIHFEVPVIASRVGGLKELIDNHTLAIGFESENPIDLANKIRSFFENREPGEKIQRSHKLYKLNTAYPGNIIKLYQQVYSFAEDSNG